MKPHSTGGAYVNFLGDEGHERVRAADGARKYQRLLQLKRRYDPDNFFRLNQNINPSDKPIGNASSAGCSRNVMERPRADSRAQIPPVLLKYI